MLSSTARNVATLARKEKDRRLRDLQDNMQDSAFFSDQMNPELDHKVKKSTERFSETLHIVSNEPSLAFFRIQEHVRKSIPQLVDKKQEVQDLQQQVQGSCFDMEYAINACKTMEKSSTHFQNIQDLLKNSMFIKQQLEYEHSRRSQAQSKPSMYGGLKRAKTADIPISINNSDEASASSSYDKRLSAIPSS
ncbi:unnamed protein product [Owenia fusiformis]|uniref:Uncharacterized protein n=1 Tax=Owenia fusiformis TaxID=6347 RepID=A0A8J1TQN0_OWEFU|nr:unnamed protein product [Owenia fusiformis]